MSQRLSFGIPRFVRNDEDNIYKPPYPESTSSDELYDSRSNLAQVEAVNAKCAKKYGEEKTNKPVFLLRGNSHFGHLHNYGHY